MSVTSQIVEVGDYWPEVKEDLSQDAALTLRVAPRQDAGDDFGAPVDGTSGERP